MKRRRLGWGLRFSVIVLKPFLTVFTRHEWSGTEVLRQLPDGVVVASNHLSWFDPFALSHMLWENGRIPRFLAKSSLFDVTFVGSVLRSAGQVPVYRQTTEAISAVRDAVAAVEAGECVVVYPEGTMTRDPDLWPMTGKTGAARIALATGCPLVPIAQWGPQQVMRPYRGEFRVLPRKTMRVRVGQPVDLSDLSTVDAESLRIATDRLMQAITELLGQLRDERPQTEGRVA